MTYSPNSGTNSQPSQHTSTTGSNNTGTTILKATPVKVTSTGIAIVNPAIEADIDALAGLVSDNVAAGYTVEIVSGGTIDNITTLINVGETVYLSTSGGLTNLKPSIGVNGFVSGDWVVRLGVIAQNKTNPLLKDIIVNIQFIGVL
jgi:hypothetical protein